MTIEVSPRRLLARRLVLGLAVLLPACGGSPSGPSTTTLFTQQFTVPGGSATSPATGFQDVNIPQTGDVQVTFDWTSTASDLDMVVTNLACTDAVAAYLASCTVFGADKSLSKPAQVLLTVTSAGSIRVWIFNFTPAQESGVMNVILTR